MTGATEFTKKAGLAGLLAIPIGFIGMVNAAGSRDMDDPDPTAGVELLILAGICMLVFTAGLLFRHRHHWWTGPLAKFGAFCVGLALFGAIVAGVPGAVPGLAGLELATGLLMIGALVAGELPRPPLVLIVLAGPMEGRSGIDVLSFVGFVWLTCEMWGESLSSRTPFEGSDRGSPVPA